MLGIEHVVDPAEIDERAEPAELPETVAVRLAREKAEAVAARHEPDTLVLAADTVVVLDRMILGKPTSPEDAERMLGQLSGRGHKVITAVALWRGGEVLERCDVTRVWFRKLNAEIISAYVATGEPLDKAGSYGVQGYGGVLIDRIDGDFFSVMGLPIRLVTDLLALAGAPYRFTR
jgi:septum formation protein